MYILFGQSSPSNPLTSTEAHLQIAHPSVPDTLILREYKEGTLPCQRKKMGYLRAGDDRSLTGSLVLTGNRSHLKDEWQADFLITRSQVQLFESLILAQQNSAIPLTLIDRFGMLDEKLVWVDLDGQWLTPYVMGVWWQLQFRAREI
jgi:hypothetical protein